MIDFKPEGYVKQFVDGSLVYEKHNLITAAASEVMLQALFGKQQIANVVFAFTDGKPVHAGLRSIISPLAFAPVNSLPGTLSYAKKDARGLRSIGVFTALYIPEDDFTYDTLALTSNLNLVFAATTFPAREVAAGQTIAVEWEIRLRG